MLPSLKASASTPAGSVNRKNGSEAKLAISEMNRPEGDITFIIQVAAVSWAATAVLETRLASQTLRNARFRQALGVEFLFMDGGAFDGARAPIQVPARRQNGSFSQAYTLPFLNVVAPRFTRAESRL
jgi:hypothetical protein